MPAMQKLGSAVVLAALCLGACDKKASPSAAPASASAQNPAAPAEPLQNNGTLDVEIDDEYTAMKVGPAYAIPTARGDGNVYRFIAFNQQARETSCATQIKGDSPVGGDNWAVSFDMGSSASPF